MINRKYLIISWENNGIFTVEDDPVVANAIAASNLNTFVRTVFDFNFSGFDQLVGRDYFKTSYHKVDGKSFEIVPLNEQNITEEWKAEQEAMFLRQDAHNFLKAQYIGAITGMERSYWDNFSSETKHELDQCDPDNNSYTRILEEYARIVNKPVAQVYKELKLTIEGEKFVRFRIHALVKFFENKIHEIKTKDQLDFIKKYIINEFWSKSQI